MKASVARGLLPAILQLVVHYDSGTEASRLRILAVLHMVRLCKIINQNKCFFTDLEAHRIQQNCDSFLDAYTRLSLDYAGKGVLAYNFLPKFHYLWHLALQCRWGCCRLWWTYGFESFQKIITDVMEQCTHGTNPMLQALSIANRMRHLTAVLAARWHDWSHSD